MIKSAMESFGVQSQALGEVIGTEATQAAQAAGDSGSAVATRAWRMPKWSTTITSSYLSHG